MSRQEHLVLLHNDPRIFLEFNGLIIEFNELPFEVIINVILFIKCYIRHIEFSPNLIHDQF
jgi:hypothetical protein